MLKEKLNFIKMVFPNVEKIIPFVTEDNLEKLFGQAQQKVGYELRRRSLNEKNLLGSANRICTNDFRTRSTNHRTNAYVGSNRLSNSRHVVDDDL